MRKIEGALARTARDLVDKALGYPKGVVGQREHRGLPSPPEESALAGVAKHAIGLRVDEDGVEYLDADRYENLIIRAFRDQDANLTAAERRTLRDVVRGIPSRPAPRDIPLLPAVDDSFLSQEGATTEQIEEERQRRQRFQAYIQDRNKVRRDAHTASVAARSTFGE